MNCWKVYKFILPFAIAFLIGVAVLKYFDQHLASLWLAIPTVFLVIAAYVFGEMGYREIKPRLEKEAWEKIRKGKK